MVFDDLATVCGKLRSWQLDATSVNMKHWQLILLWDDGDLGRTTLLPHT
jgi:hypothetical protein